MGSFRMSQALADTVVRAAYHLQQATLRYPLVAAHRLLRATAKVGAAPSPDAIAAMERRYYDLLERDIENVEGGAYPKELLFQIPLREYARAMPRFTLDIPRAYVRSRRKRFQDLPASARLDRYPVYFRRTFHWQTDGYLSRHSARIYDVSVEFLFMGCADVMRRQVIPPIARFIRKLDDDSAKILDVGCGTGRTLRQIARALPGHRYFGVDLSPYYVERARELLRSVPEASLAADNAESLPYRDGYFDVVTSTYLLHELPPHARRAAVAEMIRVLRPGGLLVLEDSAQYSDAADIATFLDNFSSEMHEPFYPGYLRDDLSQLLAAAGMARIHTEPCWVAKVVTATKPE
jgi:ubiquinone/menaquinone biosynthesis C-methylase UbiE